MKCCQVYRWELYCAEETQKSVCFLLWLYITSVCVCVFLCFSDRWPSSRHNEGHTPPTLPSCFLSALRGTNTTVMTQAVTALWACVCASVCECVCVCVPVYVSQFLSYFPKRTPHPSDRFLLLFSEMTTLFNGYSYPDKISFSFSSRLPLSLIIFQCFTFQCSVPFSSLAFSDVLSDTLPVAKSQCVGEAEEADMGEREDIRMCEYFHLKLPFIKTLIGKMEIDR